MRLVPMRVELCDVERWWEFAFPLQPQGRPRGAGDVVRPVPFLEPYADQVVVEFIAQAAVKKRDEDVDLCVNDGQFFPVDVSVALQFGRLFPGPFQG